MHSTMKFYLIAILNFIISISAHGQSSNALIFEITTDSLEVQELPSDFVDVLEDKDGLWSINDVLKSPVSETFHKMGTIQKLVDTNSIHTYWLRYKLKNVMPEKAKITFSAQNDYFDVFIIKSDSSINHYKTGLLVDLDDKDGHKIAGQGAIPLVLLPSEEIVVYDRRSRMRETNFKTTARIYSSEKKIKKEYIDRLESRVYIYEKIHLQESFILGVIFLSFFINLFFYRIVRETFYLHFSMYLLFLGINRLWNIAYDLTRWEYPEWNYYVPLLSYAWTLIPFFFIRFISKFLGVDQKYQKWNCWLLKISWFKLLTGTFAMVSFFLLPLKFDLINAIDQILTFSLIDISVLATLILFVRSKQKMVSWLMYGIFPLLLFYFINKVLDILIAPGFDIPIVNFLFSNYRLFEVSLISWLVLSISWILIMQFDILRKENSKQALEKERLEKQNEIVKSELIANQKIVLEKEVEERTSELKKSLEELKSTQSQLIQSEKMASLGELTAGIAHEIQNPLNFVNNFSELSVDLAKELKEEVEKIEIPEKDKEYVSEIIGDLTQNQEKINHHGKRASSIVKGMLEHSRKSSGTKEPTDINALADEYLRLAYHGLRAKNKDFNATMETHFDPTLPKIDIIPQDIGRVLLNLITNAFYAVNERANLLNLAKQKGDDNLKDFIYEPKITITTKLTANSQLQISIIDNGTGIPEHIKDKIFQPFFTTKPTGQGTGLGLSLAYDIVKAHGGELTIESQVGEGLPAGEAGTAFIIHIPTL